MDFYEELGISRTASEGEIRQAYRKLARILHPDQHTDEQMRLLANSQMKRLNSMLETLVDPERRREYNRSLESQHQAGMRVTALLKASHPVFQNAVARARLSLCEAGPAAWIWPMAFVIGMGGMFWFFSRNSADGPPLASVQVQPKFMSPQSQEPKRRLLSYSSVLPPKQLQILKPEPRRRVRHHGATAESTEENFSESPLLAQPELLYSLGSSEAVIAKTPTLQTDSEILELTKPPSTPPEHPVQKNVPEAGLAGQWFYVPERNKEVTKGLYPPEYIEMRISEQAGSIRGRYRARYKITDQAISPNVLFQFEGPAKKAPAAFTWFGPSGAKGRITLRTLAAGTLEVNWTATKLSDELGLASGTATLVRQQRPY